MLEFLQTIIQMQAPFNMVVLICMFFAVAGVITGVAKEIRKYGCHRQDIDFKRELVDRGLSGEEIERIVTAQVAENRTPVTVGGNCYATGAPSAPVST